MEDHQRKSTESEDLGTEMSVLEDKNYPATQFATFQFSPKRQSPDSQRANTGSGGHQTVGYVLPSQGKDAETRYDVDLCINRSPGANANTEGITLAESIQLCHGDTLDPQMDHRDILDTQLSEEDNRVRDTNAGTVNFHEWHDLQFESLSRQLHSNHQESTGVNEDHVTRRGNNHGVETSGTGNYFLPNFERDTRQRSTKPERIQGAVHSSKHKPNRGSKQHRATRGDSTRRDGEYWRKMFQNRDEVETGESRIEPNRQWYRSKRTRPQDSFLPSTGSPEFWLMLLPVIMIIIIFIAVGVLWKYIRRMLY